MPVARNLVLLVATTCLAPVATSTASATVVSEAIEVAIKYFGKTFAKELAEEGTEQTARRLAAMTSKYGDEAITVLKPLGPRAVSIAEEVGPVGYRTLQKHGQKGLMLLRKGDQQTLGLVRKYGDDGVDVLVKQPGVGAELLQVFPKQTLRTIASLSSDEAVKLSKLAPLYRQLPPKAQNTFAEKLAKGADDFVQWVYKRRKEIVATTVVTGAGGMTAVAVISAYKVGDGVAEMIPSAPDPAQSPGLWIYGYTLIILAILLPILLHVWSRRPKRTVKAASNPIPSRRGTGPLQRLADRPHGADHPSKARE